MENPPFVDDAPFNDGFRRVGSRPKSWIQIGFVIPRSFWIYSFPVYRACKVTHIVFIVFCNFYAYLQVVRFLCQADSAVPSNRPKITCCQCSALKFAGVTLGALLAATGRLGGQKGSSSSSYIILNLVCTQAKTQVYNCEKL